MIRISWIGLLVIFLSAGSFGCGGSPEVKQGTDPFKTRQATAPKEKNPGGKFMMPKGVKAPPKEQQ